MPRPSRLIPATAAAALAAGALSGPAGAAPPGAAWALQPAGSAYTGRVLVSLGGPGGRRARSAAVTALLARAGAHRAGPQIPQIGHGTHVSSLACAATNNGVGLAGAGANCGLLIEKDDLSDAGVAQAIVDATDRHVDALNMSFGTSGSSPAAPAVVDAINYAYAHNVVMAAAAADQPTTEQGDPANVLQPIGSGPVIDQGKALDVTAANFSDQRASFAGFGTQISLAAYGSFADRAGPPGLFGAFPGNPTMIDTGSLGPPPQLPCLNCRTSFQGDSRYAYLQGTSMATPIVTAVGALIRHLNPDLGVAEILRIIKQTARSPSGGWTQDLGWGILDAGRAVAAARVVDHRPPTSRVLALPAQTRKRRITVRW